MAPGLSVAPRAESGNRCCAIASANIDYATSAPFATDATDFCGAEISIENKQDRNRSAANEGSKLALGHEQASGGPAVWRKV